MGNRVNPFVCGVIETGLLILLGILPFVFILTTWLPDATLAVELLAVSFFLALLGIGGGLPKLSWLSVLILFWIAIQAFRAPVWDRSMELVAIWGTAFLVGVTTWSLSILRRDLALRVCLAIWITATAISAFNPMWDTPIEELEATIEAEGLEEGHKQAILHAASQQRFHFPFGNPIDLGTFLSFSLLAAPFLLRRARHSESSVVLMAGIAVSGFVQLYALWGTRSRTPLLGLLAGCGVWLLVSERLRRKALWAIGVVLVGVLVLFVVSPTAREMATRMETVHARLVFWEIATRMIRDAPILGLGVGGYGDHYPAYRSLTPHQTLYPHNIVLEVMTDLGAVGLILFFWMVLRWAMRSGHRPRSEAEAWGVACTASFAVGTMVGFPHDLLYLAGPWAAIAAGTLGHVPCPVLPPSRFTRAAWVGLVLVVFPLMAMREIGHVEHEKALESERVRRDVRSALVHLESAVQKWPPLSESWAYQASLYSSAGQFEEAIKRVDRAVRWEPTAGNIRSLKAEILWRKGDKDLALAAMDEAIRLHPVRWDYYQKKSQWLFELGRINEATAARERATQLEQYEPQYEQARRQGNRSESP